jgi:hypothetical protein
MSMYILTTITCSNPDVIKACVLAIRDYDAEQCAEWKDGYTAICTSMNYHIPFNEIEQVSKQFPDEVITFEHNYDSTPGDDYIGEFRNGEYKHLRLEIAYYIFPMHLGNEKDEDGIIEKAQTLFRKIDTLETDEEGKSYIDWCCGVVCYTFYYDGTDGKEYKVVATKQHWIIDFKIYENSGKDNWREITSREAPDAEPPL